MPTLLSSRRRARIAAKVEIEFEPTFSGSIDRYVERLDADSEFRHLSYSTLCGAVRAAARNLCRYDARNDAILAARR